MMLQEEETAEMKREGTFVALVRDKVLAWSLPVGG